MDIDSILNSTKTKEGIAVKQVQEEGTQFETKQWMAQKKRLEKEIVQTNINY